MVNNTEHARVRRLRRRANRLGENGYRIVPHRIGSGTSAKDGWHFIENVTNLRIAPSVGVDPVTLDVVEEAIERLEEAAEAS